MNPRQARWRRGPIPAVEEVGYDTSVVLFSDAGWVSTLTPHGSPSQALRWFGLGAPTIAPWERPSGYWTYLHEGVLPRPSWVKTQEEIRR